MKYMLLIMGFREGEGMLQPPSSGAPSAEEFMQYQRELEQSGVHVDSGLLQSFEDATQVQVNDAGERLVTNGPFAESREYLGGYQIIDVPTSTRRLTGRPGARARSTGASRCVRSSSSEAIAMGPAGEPIEAVFREERGRLLALLAARFGDLDLAEEVTAEALLAAVET